jgi:phenylacetate-CoA ligase
LLEKQLGVPVVNEYGCSEAGVIAFTNKKGEWEVDSKTLFVEILDEKNRAVPLGDEGKIVITSLHNKAHPFIRYEIGDYGALSEASTLKKPILKKLTGRTNDFATLPSGKKAAGMTFYVITKKIMEESGNMKEFKVIQTKIDTFEINYVSEEALTVEKKQFIIKTLEQFLEPGLTFNFNRKEQLDRTESGKLKQFVSLVEI